MHKIRAVVPASIVMGFESKDRYVWTCPKTGYVKVRTDIAMDQDSIGNFLAEHMHPTVYNCSTVTAGGRVVDKFNGTICPRFILKTTRRSDEEKRRGYTRNKASYKTQIYYCSQSLMNDISTYVL